MKGYTGEGFLSDGHRLGGRGRIPMQEARRLARAAAEKRRTLNTGSGQKLGGSAPRPGQDIRRVIVDAVERRNKTLQGCANDNHAPDEIRRIADTATKNGFRTQADEDAANEAAIAQALWELVQEDEKVKHGESYLRPTAGNPTGTGGEGLGTPAAATASAAKTEVSRTSQTEKRPPKVPDTRPIVKAPKAAEPASSDIWTCTICTLQNPVQYLCCDACGTERSGIPRQSLTDRSSKRPRTTIDLTKSDTRPVQTSAARTGSGPVSGTPSRDAAPIPQTWQCSFCGRVRENQWWSCDLCGKIKDSS